MHRRLFCPILAAAAVVTAMLGSADRASAAIRITISDGNAANTKVFYSATNSGAFVTEVGAFDVVGYVASTNFPGALEAGNLAAAFTLEDSAPFTPGGFLPQFTFTAEVINAVDGVSTGLVTGDNRTAVQAAALARFTIPSGPRLSVTSDVGVAQAPPGTVGTVQNFTTTNRDDPEATTIGSALVPINAQVPGERTTIAANNPSGYTLTHQVVLKDVNAGASGLAISASSAVNAAPASAELIPEPSSMAVWGLGALGFAIAGSFRRFRKTKS